MNHLKIDTSTTEGFNEACEVLNLHPERLARLINVNLRSVKYWKHGDKPVHPTAGVMLDWMIDGFRPEGWHYTGPEFAQMRIFLRLSIDQMAKVLDAEPDTIKAWESDFHGPPPFVAQAVKWIVDGYRPKNFPT